MTARRNDGAPRFIPISEKYLPHIADRLLSRIAIMLPQPLTPIFTAITAIDIVAILFRAPMSMRYVDAALAPCLEAGRRLDTRQPSRGSCGLGDHLFTAWGVT